MAIQQLSGQHVQPKIDYPITLLNQIAPATDTLALQARLNSALNLFCPTQRKSYDYRFMLLKAPESPRMFSLLRKNINQRLLNTLTGYAYHVNERKVTLSKAQSWQDNFAARSHCLSADWADYERLFGCVRLPDDDILKLQPGLVHKANGGILLLSLNALLDQPLLFKRLKHIVIQQEFEWISPDESNPLPLAIPNLPLDLRVILVGDRLSLSDLEALDPELYQTALYAEFENELSLTDESSLVDWVAYLNYLAQESELPDIAPSAITELLKAGCRYTEDQHTLPLSVDWLTNLLADAARISDHSIDQQAILQAQAQKRWQQGYLVDKFREEITNNQLIINTQGQVVGQINGLSVIEYPGYPLAIGEPTRLSCLVHFGDGELIDIERKNELAGNIHSKGMMIMQAFIAAEFALQHQLPFSASLVFEQSYSEIDGDSASLAGLCVLISALSLQPIDQQLAVTGSVDQFGHVQAIGGVNEKIEGFFAVCKHQGLTGQQGVVIPAANQRHLCLSDEVCDAIKAEQFAIWLVDDIAEALYLLTGIPYKDDGVINLYQLIQARIQQMLNQDRKGRGWLSRWRK